MSELQAGPGALFAIGGAEDKLKKRTVLQEFVEAAGGSKARIVVVPTASSLGPDVVDVDAAKQSVTVRGPQRTVDIKVRDPEQFKRIAKGDQLEATYTEAVAIAVTPKK